MRDTNGVQIRINDKLRCISECHEGRVWREDGGIMTDCRGWGDEYLYDCQEDDLLIVESGGK